MQPTPRTFSSYKTETLYPLNNSHPLIPPSNPWRRSFYFVSLSLRTLDTSESEIRQCLFGTGLFHLAECPQDSFLHGSISENLLLFFFSPCCSPVRSYFPNQRCNLCSLQWWKLGVLTTRPPGKSFSSPSFLRLNNIPLHVYIIFYLPILPFIDIWNASTFLALVNSAAMNMRVQLSL